MNGVTQDKTASERVYTVEARCVNCNKEILVTVNYGHKRPWTTMCPNCGVISDVEYRFSTPPAREDTPWPKYVQPWNPVPDPRIAPYTAPYPHLPQTWCCCDVNERPLDV